MDNISKILRCENCKILKVCLAIFRSVLPEYEILQNKTILLGDSKYNEFITKSLSLFELATNNW